MKSTGIVRRLDDLGRVVLPKELRKTFKIYEGDALEIFTEDEKIILRKYNPGCQLCGSLDNVLDIDGVKICKKCAVKIAGKIKKVVE